MTVWNLAANGDHAAIGRDLRAGLQRLERDRDIVARIEVERLGGRPLDDFDIWHMGTGVR